MLEHDIEVGEAKPIKQHFYQVSAEKCVLLGAEIGYMLSNGIVDFVQIIGKLTALPNQISIHCPVWTIVWIKWVLPDLSVSSI